MSFEKVIFWTINKRNLSNFKQNKNVWKKIKMFTIYPKHQTCRKIYNQNKALKYGNKLFLIIYLMNVRCFIKITWKSL